MPNASLRRKIFVCLLLLTVLAVPWASAAGRAAPAPDLFHRAWSFFVSLWNKTGCHIDPNGLCGIPKILPDEGCDIDPFGRCGKSQAAPPAPLVLPDTGCNVDPNGHCGSS
jgi:hypothetical protein